MPGTHYVSRQSDRIDQVTGLPRMPTALAELSGLIRENQPDRQLGIISLAVVTDPLLFRQSADALRRIRLEISQQIGQLLRPQDRIYAISSREWVITLPNLLSSAVLMLAMIRLRDGLAALPGRVDTAGVGGQCLDDTIKQTIRNG